MPTSQTLSERRSREALAPVFAELNRYEATMHLVAQSTIFTLTGCRATGEAYGLAHHATVDGGKRGLMLASLRDYDTFVKMDRDGAVCGALALRGPGGRAGPGMKGLVFVGATGMVGGHALR
jgi:hypothetical protein